MSDIRITGASCDGYLEIEFELKTQGLWAKNLLVDMDRDLTTTGDQVYYHFQPGWDEYIEYPPTANTNMKNGFSKDISRLWASSKNPNPDVKKCSAFLKQKEGEK